jgi:hypothetical protein
MGGFLCHSTQVNKFSGQYFGTNFPARFPTKCLIPKEVAQRYASPLLPEPSFRPCGQSLFYPPQVICTEQVLVITLFEKKMPRPKGREKRKKS